MKTAPVRRLILGYRITISTFMFTYFLTLAISCGKDGPTKSNPSESTEPTPIPSMATRIEIHVSTHTLTIQTIQLTGIGQTVQLAARVFDQNNALMTGTVVSWRSFNTDTATVSSLGLVAAVANGTARVEARTGSVTAVVTVTVSAGSIVIGSGIDAVPNRYLLRSIGETIQLTATVLDRNKLPVENAIITWESSDRAIATVDDRGLVTAVKNGTARITARSGDKSPSSTVVGVVQVPNDIVFEISSHVARAPNSGLADTSVALTEIGQTMQIDVLDVLDSNGHTVADYNLAWGSENEAVATVNDQGLVSAVMNGFAGINVRATTIPGSQISAGTRVHITVTVATYQDWPALMSLYWCCNGSRWEHADVGWGSGRPLGEWEGVTADGEGRVTALDLSGNRVNGSIPPELADLDKLEYLDLSNNRLTGEIPTELGTLGNLEYLDLSFNDNNFVGLRGIEGSIPAELGALGNLEHLDLSDNSLTGPIPPELGSLENVNTMSFYANRLTGSLPSTFLSLDKLESLDIHLNDGLCYPNTPDFSSWLRNLSMFRGAPCR